MNIALVLSGGTGTRLDSVIPKQYIQVEGKPIIYYCLKRLMESVKIDAIQIVAESQWQNLIGECMEPLAGRTKLKGFSNPGENRQLSIFNGLKDVGQYASETDYILVHDAARPILSEQQICECFDQAANHDGVIPVLPMKDTVYFSKNGKSISGLINRSEIFAGQAPEVFVYGKYYEANRRLLPDKILDVNGSTEPAIMANMDIVMIPGDENNFKITTSKDLERFKERLKQKKG